ncbi:MAG: type II toxin-antitoxin system VapC family toxin [Oscillochloris sp.]|nr:type II toxin-antitoxin system VapC family toxin [Oscillochloris sp.]
MSRPLTDIPAGATVMLDANVLVYAFTPQSQFHASCVALLERGARGTLSLFTSVSVTADVLHRAMVLELLAQGQAQRSAEAVALLKQRPDLVQQLNRYRSILRDLRQARVDILPLTYRDLHASRTYREQHGLMVNDSLIVAVMRRETIPFLATNDLDFERVPGLAIRIPHP